MKARIHTLLILLFVLVTAYRLCLVGNGANALPDEGRYRYSLDLAKDVVNGDKAFVRHLFRAQGRPAEVLLRSVIPVIQMKWAGMNRTEVMHPDALIYHQIFNILISLICLWLVFLIAKKLWPANPMRALLISVFYAFLFNSNLYLRHLLPFDHALLFALLAIWLLLNDEKKRNIWLAGFATGLSFLFYPGFYTFSMMIFLFAGLILLQKKKLIRLLPLAGAFLIVIIITHLLSILTKQSYLENAFILSGTVTQGDFSEGLVYIPKYLVRIERLAGLFILAGNIIYLFLLLKNRIWKEKNDLSLIDFLFISVWAVALVHIFMSAAMNAMVFYGRLLHWYVPFLVIFSLKAWSGISFLKPAFLDVLVLLITLTSAFWFLSEIRQYAYPYDVLIDSDIDGTKLKAEQKVFESTAFYPVDGLELESSNCECPYEELTLVNFAFLYPVFEGDCYKKFAPKRRHKLIFKKKYFMAMPAYQFENFGPKERKLISERDYQLQIYCSGH